LQSVLLYLQNFDVFGEVCLGVLALGQFTRLLRILRSKGSLSGPFYGIETYFSENVKVLQVQ